MRRAAAELAVGEDAGLVAAEFVAGFVTGNTRAARNAKLATLACLAEAAGVTFFPLNVAALRIILGVMKTAGDRPIETYVTAVRTARGAWACV